jgi:protein-S-isoprenylcysteine O-methyltransferase Ste14
VPIEIEPSVGLRKALPRSRQMGQNQMGEEQMRQDPDTSNAAVRPPFAWLIALAAGIAANWLRPLPFVPASVRAAWIGVAIFALAFALGVWAIVTIRKAGTQVETYKATTAIVANGPYRFTRNPIYLGMMLGLIGLAVALDSLWLLAMLVPFYLVIRYGVVAREEAYLERKFGDAYLGYKSRVRRWL